MKTVWQSHERMITSILVLFVYLSFHPKASSAQSTFDTSMCAYQETRKNVPINPKTNKPYTPAERNQEPFAGASITKEHIKQCLRARIMLRNHHSIFEDYRDAWKELAEETGDYAIPLWIQGGVLHAKTLYDEETHLGGIGLWEFRDPTITDVSKLTEEEGRLLGGIKKHVPIAFIRPMIVWTGVFIDSVITALQEARPTIFSKNVYFGRATFSKKVYFSQATPINSPFGLPHDPESFSGTIFSAEATFAEATFGHEANFADTIFSHPADFRTAIFEDKASFNRVLFSSSAFWGGVTFSNHVSFYGAIYDSFASFYGATFRNKAFFSGVIFKYDADFNRAIFKDNADFRDIRADETLRLKNTTWEGRLDLHGMSTKALDWNSEEHPSEVKGIFDLREALIGLATFHEVKFQDVVDFSRTTFGQYKVKQEDGTDTVMAHAFPQVLFTNNTFEKEVDFLHVTFKGSAILINNRFRSTLDLTGALFPIRTAHVCLSFNRIKQLVLGLDILGSPPGWKPWEQWKSLVDDIDKDTSPLSHSRIRQIVFTKRANSQKDVAPQCVVLHHHETANPTTRQVEKLEAIYKTIGQGFLEAKDQSGVNEAWYLQTVAKWEQDSSLWAGQRFLSWVLFDIPSRYTVDVWRTVWVSMGIMLVFYIFYVGELWRLGRSMNMDHGTIHVPEYATRQRAFRIRLFEPIHRKDNQRIRRLIPWRDAATLSFRAFTKIGLGTSYPNTRRLKVLTTLEWVLGVYMLIHFILAMKNNLPFILPFLGVVN